MLLRSRLVAATAAVTTAAVILAASRLSVLAQTRPSDIHGHWAEDRIVELLERHIVSVGAEQQFNPNAAVTRAQFIAWLVTARGLPPVKPEPPAFADLSPGGEFAPAVQAAAAYGIVPSGGTFRPGAPLVRADAFVFLVRALGHTFEAAYMVNASLPFRDVTGLPPTVRGAIAVVTLSIPALLREPASDRVRPFDVMTRAEAASLLWGYLQAVEHGMSLSFTISLGTGVTLILEKRGALRILPFWRVQVGAFQDEDRAQRLADQMRGLGLPVVVDQVDDLFKVRVGTFTTREEATALQQRLAAQGMVTWLIQTVRDYDALAGPFWTGILLIEPAAGARLRPSLAREEIGRGRTSEVARRSGAIAAINGGFFNTGTGDPLGCLVIEGEVISEPVNGRTCVGITDDGQLLFDTLRLDAAAGTDSGTVTINGVDRERGADEVVIYRPSYGTSTHTNAFGVEVVVSGDTVQQVVDGRGNNPIPAAGYVLSGHGRARAALLATFKPGDRVTAHVRLAPASGDPRWDGAREIIGGGPRLLANGQYVGGEGFLPSFSDRRHPRTAIGRLADGRIVLVVVGGRQPYHSLGMTLSELAVFLRQLGVIDALNLDGGGSSTLVVRGVVINLPSDETGERPVSDVLLVLPPAAGDTVPK